MHLGWWDHMTPSDHLTVTAIVVTAVMGLAAITTQIVIHRRQRRLASVDYQVVADIKLIDSDAAEAFGDRIKVTLNGKPLRHPRIVDVWVMNTGNTEVRDADYQQPIVFELDGGHPPLDATVMGESSPNITGNLFAPGDPPRTISIKPELLNKGEWFTLRMLFDNNDSRLIGRHRIVGGLPMRQRDFSAQTRSGRFVRTSFKVWAVSSAAIVVISAFVSQSFGQGLRYSFLGVSTSLFIMVFVNAVFMPE